MPDEYPDRGPNPVDAIDHDTIWEAEGDLLVGVGPDTGTRLPVGSDGDVLTVDLDADFGLIWAPAPAGTGVPPGGLLNQVLTKESALDGDADWHDPLPGPQGPVGPQGPQGTTGAQGPAGPGVPTGGSSGQVLTKTSATDFATAWQAPAGADLSGYLPLSAGSSKPLTGQLYFGSTPDTSLYRAAAGQLRSDGKLTLLGDLWLYDDSGSSAYGLAFGTAKDTIIYRGAANRLNVDATNGLVANARIFSGTPGQGGIWVDGGTNQFVGSESATRMGFYQSGWRLLLDGNGQLQLNNAAGAAAGILLAGDANLYRDAADVLATDDQFWIKGAGGLKFPDGTTQTTAAAGGGGGFTTVTKTADDQVLNSITLTADTHLFFATVSGAVYEFEAVIIVSSAVSSNDVRLAFGEDTTIRGAWGGPSVSAADGSGTFSQPTVTNIGSIGGTGAGVQRAFAIRGAHVAAGGTFRFHFCQNTADATNPTIIKAGSLLRYRRIV